MNRSTCASGSGYVPSDSIGFCVAITRNGCGTKCVSWPIVTWCSCITSSSADCTFAGARLISSARRKLQNTGPRSVSNPALVGPVDARPDEVGGDEVGRELDPPERAAEHGRGRLDRQRLREAGDALDQEVAAGDEADEHALEHLVLPGDHALDLDERLLEESARLVGVALCGVGRRLGRRDGGLALRCGHVRSSRRRRSASGRRAARPSPDGRPPPRPPCSPSLHLPG